MDTESKSILAEAMGMALQKLLPACPGRHCLFLGGLAEHAAFRPWTTEAWAVALETEASMEHQAEDVSADGAGQVTLRLDLHQLPFASASVDVLVLPMTLDFDPLPQKVMREVDRVLRDDGLLLLFCINPWSPWHLLQLLPGRSVAPKLLGQKHWLSRRRVCEWLTLLGFDPENQLGLLHGLPFLKRQHQLKAVDGLWQKTLAGWGTLYAIKAVKRTLPLTRIPAKSRRFRFHTQPSRPTVAVGRLGK